MNNRPDYTPIPQLAALAFIVLACWIALHAPKGEPMPGAPERYLEVNR